MDTDLAIRIDEHINAVMPPFANNVLTALFWGCFAVYIVIAIRRLVTKKDDRMLILMLGAFIAFPGEPFLDFVCRTIFPPVGSYVIVKYWWTSLPWFMAACYPLYLSTWAFAIIHYIRKNPANGRAIFWKFFAALVVFCHLIESIPIHFGLWFYDGNQPLRLFGFPAYLCFVNANMVMTFTAAGLCFLELFNDYRRYLFLLIGGYLVPASYAGAGWPTAAFIFKDYPASTAVFGALVSILFALVSSYLLCHLMMFVINNKRSHTVQEVTAKA